MGFEVSDCGDRNSRGRRSGDTGLCCCCDAVVVVDTVVVVVEMSDVACSRAPVF